MKKIKKSKLKGMTLAEIVVSMVVFTVSATILVTGAISVYKMISSTRKLTQKINYQVPVADKMLKASPTVTDVTVNNSFSEIQIQLPNGVSYAANVEGFEVVPEIENQPAGNLKYFK